MTTALLILLILTTWTAISIPVALIVGRLLGRSS